LAEKSLGCSNKDAMPHPANPASPEPLQIYLLIARVGEAILQYGRTSGIRTVLWLPLKPEADHQQGAAAFVVHRPNQAFHPSPFDNAGKVSSLPPIPTKHLLLRCIGQC
jgi:hypothetical protein